MNGFDLVQATINVANDESAPVDEADLQYRHLAREVLRAATTDQDSLRAILTRYAECYPKGMPIVERPALINDRAGSFSVRWDLDWSRVPSGTERDHEIAYVAAMLHSDELRCRSDLRCCKLDKCGRFFFVERGKAGRPRDSYCSAEHLKIAHEKDSARRHRISKARQGVQSEKTVAPRDRKDLEDIARLARWVGALEVDDEFTFTAEQLQRIARLIIARAGRIAA